HFILRTAPGQTKEKLYLPTEGRFFECARWKDYRSSAEEAIGAWLSPSSQVTYMITQEENWSAVAAYAQRDKIAERDQ
ncbi:hypothetical protein J6590_075109, partial [Homalodisca vitripennis]